MLFNITLKANEQRELNGTGQYFNLLSSSAGKVRIRALDSDAREIISTEILNGDAIEFERLVAKLYVTASEDAAAVLYFSQHKLVNNGVTVRPAGSLKTSVVGVSGLSKLNTITAQNKQIKIKPAQDIFLSSNENGLNAVKLKKDEWFNIETFSDVYALSKQPVSKISNVANVNLIGSTSANVTSLIGKNDDIAVYGVKSTGATGAFSNIGLKNNSFVNLPELYSTLMAGVNVSATSVSKERVIHLFNKGFFYIVCFIQPISTVQDIFVLKTKDYIDYELVSFFVGPFNLNTSSSPKAEIDLSGRYIAVASSSDTYILDLERNISQAYSVDGGRIAGAFGYFATKTNKLEFGLEPVPLTGISGTEVLAMSNTNIGTYKGNPAILHTDGLWVLNGTEFKKINIGASLPARGSGLAVSWCIIGDKLYCLYANSIREIDLNTATGITADIQAPGQSALKRLIFPEYDNQTGTISLNYFGSDNSGTSFELYKVNNLETVRYSIGENALVEVLELF